MADSYQQSANRLSRVYDSIFKEYIFLRDLANNIGDDDGPQNELSKVLGSLGHAIATCVNHSGMYQEQSDGTSASKDTGAC